MSGKKILGTACSAWLGWALLSAASFAAMGACVRIASRGLPAAEVVFFRNFFALLTLLPLALRQGVTLRTRVMHLHLLRAGSGLAAMYLYFHALARLPLADAILLNYTSPLFIMVFAVFWLGEKMTAGQVRALLLGSAGVVLLFHPSGAIASPAGLMGLGSGMLAGLALATVRRLSATEPSARIVLYFALCATAASLLPLPAVFVPPRPAEWGWLVAVGVLGSIGQLGLTCAYRLAPASQVSPLGYASLLFASLIGFFAWGERPDAPGVLGMLAIVAAGVVVARERREPLPAPPGGVPEKRI